MLSLQGVEKETAIHPRPSGRGILAAFNKK
jgi:hypothetical protein